jgi:hypothetical protein
MYLPVSFSWVRLKIRPSLGSPGFFQFLQSERASMQARYVHDVLQCPPQAVDQ